MAACTFLGHRDCPNNIFDRVAKQTENLILNCGVDLFYLGSQGNFDNIAKMVLLKLKKVYPAVKCYIVLAYMPSWKTCDSFDTIYPFVLEKTPKRFAINKRNEWMIEQADFVISYFEHNYSNTSGFISRAEKKGKKVINTAMMQQCVF